MPTLLELDTIEECAHLAGSLGLSFVEINMNMPQYQIERVDAKALRRLAAGGPYFTFHLDENFNPSDFNRLVARAYIETAVANRPPGPGNRRTGGQPAPCRGDLF